MQSDSAVACMQLRYLVVLGHGSRSSGEWVSKSGMI